MLIRLRAHFVAKSAGGVWEKQFYKSLELGNSCPEGGGRTSGWFHCNCMGQKCTMHIAYPHVCISAFMHICIYSYLHLCISAFMHICISGYCMYACMHICILLVCKYADICATAWLKKECVSVHRLVFTFMHVHVYVQHPNICACDSVCRQ